MLKKYYKQLLLAAAATAAGFVNGFLGTGGGIILMLALSFVQIDERDKFATVIAVILPMSLVSALFYGTNIASAEKWLIPGMLGGVTGAILLERINVKWLKKLFALMIIWAGINFIK